MRSLLPTLVCLSTPLYAEALAATIASGFDLLTRVKAAEVERSSDLHEMTSSRKYVLRNQRWNEDAVMHVRIYSGVGGKNKRYEILSMAHADGVKKKAFLKLLEAEVEASRDSKDDSSISTANYDFVPAGLDVIDGRTCIVVQLVPKGKSKLLLDGKVWLDSKEDAIVKLEGKTVKNVSFWIGKPHVTQSFQKISGMWVSARNLSVSDVRFLGKTELTIDYLHYKITRSPSRNFALTLSAPSQL